MFIIVVFGNAVLINRYPRMLRVLFHISIFARRLISLIMAHLPAIGDLGLVVLYVHGVGVPLTFQKDEDGLAIVTAQRLSLRFGFREDTIIVDEDVFDVVTSELTHTLGRVSQRDENNNLFWSLHPGRYRVFGLTDSQMAASTEILTPRNSSTCTIQTPLPRDVKVKIEPGLETPIVENVRVPSVITLSSDEEGSPTKPPPQIVPGVNAPKVYLLSLDTVSILPLLKQLATMPGKKNVLKKIDYSVIRHERVEYLPALFDGPVIFELPPAGHTAARSQAKSMQGMDKRYDGHVWTKTITTNITNDFGLSFRSSSCVGHLRCNNKECEYLIRRPRIFEVNETEFEGCTLQAFVVDQAPPTESTLVCKVCKEPPSCIATCGAKIYYVAGKSNHTRACIHLGNHDHPVKVGDYRDTKAEISGLIEEQIEKTPQATKSAVVLEASKVLIGSYLLQPDDAPPKKLSLEELIPVFDRCKDMASPNIRNKVMSFRFLRRYGVMDSITKLRGISLWSFVQENKFPGQGTDLDKVFVFKMSEVGPGSGVDLVKRMQPGEDLENAWIMFDHVKRVRQWTTMACHVYDSTYCRVMTIASCDMQSEDCDAQIVFWKNLNAVMERNGVVDTNFKGFMADSAQANWNAVRVIYGNGKKEDRMDDRERTCQFHWTQSMVKYTEKYIPEELWEQHKKMCHQYRTARTMDEAESMYHGLRAWWVSAGVVTENALNKLELWLAFWHFRYRQWGGFMTGVCFSNTLHIVFFLFTLLQSERTLL